MSNINQRTSKNLSAGEFYSPVVRQSSGADFTLTELHRTASIRFPKHMHEAAFFCLLLGGHYAEFFGSRSVDYKPLTIAWHPPALTHYDEVGTDGAHFFMVEVKSPLIKKLSEYSAVPEQLFSARGEEISCLGMRLFREFKADDAASPLAIEGLLLEMLAAAARIKPAQDKHAPVWLKRVLECLEAEYTENISIESLAREAGVHPAHLSSTFRRFRNETIGEYIQKLRVGHASNLLLNKEMPLADIAAAAGFSDQSHFTRIFKRLNGTTPGAFRTGLTGN